MLSLLIQVLFFKVCRNYKRAEAALTEAENVSASTNNHQSLPVIDEHDVSTLGLCENI